MLKLVVLALFVYLASGFIIVDDDIINEKEKVLYDDCHGVFLSGYRTPGIYRLSDLDLVYCDFDSTKGSIVLLRRIDSTGNFAKDSKSYANGFGNFKGTFWYGLKRAYKFTNKKNNTVLNVKFTDWDDKVYTARYGFFSVGQKPEYKLAVKDFSGSGDVSDALTASNGQEFAALDRPDKWGCVENTRAGWWFTENDCSDTLPTGHYYQKPKYDKQGKYFNGMYWSPKPHAKDYSLKTIQISLSKM